MNISQPKLRSEKLDDGDDDDDDDNNNNNNLYINMLFLSEHNITSFSYEAGFVHVSAMYSHHYEAYSPANTKKKKREREVGGACGIYVGQKMGWEGIDWIVWLRTGTGGRHL